MSENWTPGPLRVGKPFLDDGRCAIIEHGGQWANIGYALRVVGGPGDVRPALANAQLWSAAPNMYKALEPLTLVWIHPDEPDDKRITIVVTAGQIRAMRAATAKARGETG